jgi:RimJ/RimL family protein N-acetyltransferase
MIQPKIATPRLLLRRWSPRDAPRLLIVLEQNLDHLRHWIPEDVYTPVPTGELERRLRSYAADFDAQRAWRFAIFIAESRELIGEVSLFPRSVNGRGPLKDADRVEIGYWLRADATGQGFATEATQALIAACMRIQGVGFAEIRCDSRNESSVAIPRRLGFSLAREEAGSPRQTDMVWRLPLAQA